MDRAHGPGRPEVAEETPEKIFKAEIDPVEGPNELQANELARNLGLNEVQCLQFREIFNGLIKLFLEKDLSLVEVNPLVIKYKRQLFPLKVGMVRSNKKNNACLLKNSFRAVNLRSAISYISGIYQNVYL